jgi:lipopolysaccharide/colanic/teichoic acid biosynthesis glycosyltransferase
MYFHQGKRLLDVAVALLLALPACLICLVCAVAIRLGGSGPAIFRQQRVGRDRRIFVLYKLRTMSSGTANRASHEVSPAQITRVGHVLRRTKLDELPQILNVLRGDMSFVGPRPCLPDQVELVEERQRRGVHALRPGVTGLAQLSGLNMSTPVALAEADAAYLQRGGLSCDLKIMALTALGRGRGDAVASA